VRILHTSDWHLGRLFHRASLLDEQAAALARIVEVVREERVDVVVIAGDLYDRAIPPAEAVELFDTTLLELRRAGAAIVAISGNHDSAVRVGYGDRLLAEVGVTVRGDLSRAADPVELPARDGGASVVVYPIPYLDPLAAAHVSGVTDAVAVDVPADGADHTGEARRRVSHHDAMTWATARARADLAQRRSDGARVRSVVVAHTFLTGGNPSESERELTQGNVDQVRLDAFDGFDYVALGHLHQGQAFDGGRVAYSGTPLPYSFSEQHHTKAVRLVDLAPDGTVDVRVVPLGVGRGVHTLTGTLDQLLTDPALHAAERAWVQAVLTDPVLPLQAMSRLQRRFPHTVELRHEPPTDRSAPAARRSGAQLRQADPLELAVEFLQEQRGLAAAEEEQRLLAEALRRVRAEVTS